MRFGTKILLLALLIAVGTSATLAWVVTLNITRYETRRCDERTSAAIAGYVAHLDDEHRQIGKIVRTLLEEPKLRSMLQEADESSNAATREQLRQEIFGRTVQTELGSTAGPPAFHVLVNAAGEVLLTAAPGDPDLEKALSADTIHWPVDAVIGGSGGGSIAVDGVESRRTAGRPVDQYILLPRGLFLAMGVPLRTQLADAPSHAYFVGYRVNDDWVRRQLVSQRGGFYAPVQATAPTNPAGGATVAPAGVPTATAGAALSAGDAPLAAWFFANDRVIAKASAAGADARIDAFSSATPVVAIAAATQPASQSLGPAESIEFRAGGERFIGQRFELNPGPGSPGRLVLASSLDQALQPLRELQKQILMFSIAACLAAVVLCRWMARRLARPVQELVRGTQQIAAGHFDSPVNLQRHDELGQLGVALNEMAGGLKERDSLRDERTKTQRDLAVARKIQMDVLPTIIPPCPGYDIATYSLPAEQTGGDIFDIVALPGENQAGGGDSRSLVLLLADATGHGIGPALSVTQVRAMLRIGVRLRAGLDQLLSQINRQLCQDLAAERFVTAFLGLLDPRSHAISYYSAGQGPLLHFRAFDRSLVWMNATMLPLGIMEAGDSPSAERIELQPGDLAVLLTDGFYEYHNPAGEQFDKDRVAAVMVEHYAKSAAEILKHLLAATNAFAAGAPQLDDMTAIIIKRESGDPASKIL